MQHIRNDPVLGCDFSAYFAYLESVRERMPDTLYAFAADERNYDLTSHSSLHDAWLENIKVDEIATGARQENRSVQIRACYLGPFHDVRIDLIYRGVTAYSLQTPTAAGGHGDLLIHEIRAVEDSLFEHELVFASSAAHVIRFRDLEHTIQPI